MLRDWDLDMNGPEWLQGLKNREMKRLATTEAMDLKGTRSLADAAHACRDLEEMASKLYSRLHDPARQDSLKEAREDALSARRQQEKVASEFPAAQRSRRTAQSRLQSTLDELNDTLLSNAQQEKDLHGLRRTLQKLQEQLQAAKNRVKKIAQETSLLDKEEADLLLEQQSVQSYADAMKSEEEALAQGVADERQKRMELKAACRQRIQKIEQSKLELRNELEKRLGDLDSRKSAFKKQEESTEASRANMLRCKEEAETAGNEASLALQEMQEIHEEWGHAQKQHADLEDALKQMKTALQGEIEEEAQALINWRQNYMQRLDSKLEARRARELQKQCEPVAVPVQTQSNWLRVHHDCLFVEGRLAERILSNRPVEWQRENC